MAEEKPDRPDSPGLDESVAEQDVVEQDLMNLSGDLRTSTTSPTEKLYKIQHALVVTKQDGREIRAKTKMFDFLDVPLDDYNDLTFTEQEINTIRRHFLNLRTGLAAMVPLVCGGPARCPFIRRCPFYDRVKPLGGQDIKKFPLLRQCIVERQYALEQRQGYVDEYEADPNSPSEMALINRLAELDVYDYRASLVLAYGDKDGHGQDGLKEQNIGMSPTGEKLTRLELHPAWELKERIGRQRLDILQALVGTRKEQYKRNAALKEKSTEEVSIISSSLRAKLDSLKAKNTIIDVVPEPVEAPKD